MARRRKIDPVTAWDHIDELAAKLRVTVRPCKARAKAEAHIATRQVWVPPQRAPIDYMLALHELGHIGSSVSRRHYRWYAETEKKVHEVCCEAAAWAWAVEHALPAITGPMSAKEWQEVADYLATYLSVKRR